MHRIFSIQTKSAQELTRRNRKTVFGPAPPRDREYGIGNDQLTDYTINHPMIHPYISCSHAQTHTHDNDMHTHTHTHTHTELLWRQCGCLHGRVIEKGRTRSPLTLRTVSVRMWDWEHILGDCRSVQLRNATTTIIIIIMNKFSIALFPVKKKELNALNSKCTTDE